MLELLRKYLSCQEVFSLIFKVQSFNLIIHTALLYIFLIIYKTDLLGVTIILNINAILNYVVTVCFINAKYVDKKPATRTDENYVRTSILTEAYFTRCNYDSVKSICEYLKYGIPSSFMFCIEVWFFESFTLFSGLLSIDDQGACIILINISAFIYMIPLGMSYAASNLIGNSLGSGKTYNARLYAIVILIFSLV